MCFVCAIYRDPRICHGFRCDMQTGHGVTMLYRTTIPNFGERVRNWMKKITVLAFTFKMVFDFFYFFEEKIADGTEFTFNRNWCGRGPILLVKYWLLHSLQAHTKTTDSMLFFWCTTMLSMSKSKERARENRERIDWPNNRMCSHLLSSLVYVHLRGSCSKTDE